MFHQSSSLLLKVAVICSSSASLSGFALLLLGILLLDVGAEPSKVCFQSAAMQIPSCLPVVEMHKVC